MEVVKGLRLRTETKKNKRKEILFLFAMLAVPVANWLLFWLYVNFSSILLAFQDARTGGFTFNNFVTFWDNLTMPGGEIGIAVKNTFLYFATSLFIIMPISLFISYFLYKKIFMYKIFRVIFYLPAIISGVALVAVYSNFINPNGPLSYIFKLFGKVIPPEGLLARPETATKTIIGYCIWTGFSGYILLFSGGMSRIPEEVLESAKIDGCGAFRELIQVILPMMWPTVSTQIVLLFTGLFSASGPILLFTNGNAETTTISFWIFKQVYGDALNSYNIVSATGLVFTIIGVPVILFVRWLMDKVAVVEY